MRRLVHYELGEPAKVLRLEKVDSPSMTADQVRVRVHLTPVHPGDLLGVMGSPAFGTPPNPGARGRVPGFEGAGTLLEIGANVDPTLGLKPGTRVVFFPAGSTWSDEVVVQASSIIPLPDDVADETAAQCLINTATALTAIRAAYDALPPDGRENIITLLTAAGSAVGKLISKILVDHGVTPIRLVRSESSVKALSASLPTSPVFATETGGWKEGVRAFAGDRKIHVAIDSVGGRLLGEIADLLVDGAGTVVNFGSLGGETSDIRLFAPRSLTLKGVVVGSWMRQSAEQRKEDIALGLNLARKPEGLFEVADCYSPSQFAEAIEHVGRAGRTGIVLLDFS